MSSFTVAVGGVIGHYRILELLGEGGMGVVYRAHDERLGRDVALKFLPPSALENEISRKRFHKEARALAKLSHPNIATVYDFDSQEGVDFLVAEYVPGQTLAAKLVSGAISQKEALRLGMQLADGLLAAHESGVLHRDLKPSNLQIMPDGRLKILDFGLAQFCHPSSGATTESVADLQCAGTLPYAAPEQLRGGQGSIRSDIYSAGAVLYEMCTGRRAFGEGSAFQVMHSILHEMPKPPSQLSPKLSPQLEQIIVKCLDKEPENRYQSAVELGVDLRRLSLPSSTTYIIPPRRPRLDWRKALAAALVTIAVSILLIFKASAIKGWLVQPSGPGIRSMAVLPLQNLSGNPDQDYFADGMTEELITDLAQISALRVISRTSAMTYKGSSKSLPQIARELNVDAVLEGSVVRVQDRVRITAQLIQAQTDQHIWAKSYEGKASDILTLQGDVARAIADEIQIKLTAEELRRLSIPRAVVPEAHENYLLGRYYWSKRTKEGIEKSVYYLEQAVARDPNYALAYAALSDSYQLLPDLAGSSAKEAYEKARPAALKAIQLDPSLAETHASMAKLKENYEWDWRGAEGEYRQAIELNSGLSVIHAWYSNLLAETGNTQEALVEARKAEQLDPMSSYASQNLGFILYVAGEYAEALVQNRKTLDIDPGNARAYRNLGRIYCAQGRYNDAAAEYKKAIELSPGTPDYLAELGYTYGVSGLNKEAMEILNELEKWYARGDASPYILGVVYTGMGKRELALQWLEKSVEERAAGAVQLKVSPIFNTLRTEPRFQMLLRQIGFSE